MYYRSEHNFSPEDVLVYLRKSRSDDPLLSVDEVLQKHETILDEWAERNLGGVVPPQNKYREIVSGETIENRPEIQKILKLIENPRYKAILIVEVQRLSRGDLEDAGRIIKLLRYTNTVVITPQQTFDLTNEYDRDFFERDLKRGNEFLEYTKKIMARGRLASVSEGNYIGSLPPYGYEKTIIQDGKRKHPSLKIKPDEADVVRMIFDLYVNSDMGTHKLCYHLDKLGYKPARGEHWTREGLLSILDNITYTGKTKWNFRKVVTVVDDGELMHTRPRTNSDEYMVFDGKHEAIISDELFKAAREKRGRGVRTTHTNELRNPLAGLVYCQCGKAMSYRTKKEPGSDKDLSSPRLSCTNQIYCRSTSCLYEEMEQRVIAILRETIANFELKVNKRDKAAEQVRSDYIHKLEAKLKDLEKKEINMWEAQADPDPSRRMPDYVFQNLNKKLLEQKAEIRKEINEAYQSTTTEQEYEEKIYRFRDALDALTSPTASAAQKNKLLKLCIKRITYTRGKAERNTNRDPNANADAGGWITSPMELDFELYL